MSNQPTSSNRARIKKETMDFDDPDERKHDVVLDVKGTKFFCVKATLAKHADYFQQLFFVRNLDKNTREYVLEDPTSSEAFQTFLEVIHGVRNLTDDNVNEVLRLACLWSAAVAKNRCIEHLTSQDCKKELKEKFQIACENKLEGFLELVLDSFKDAKTLNELCTPEIMKLDQPLIGSIFSKSLELSGKTVPESPDVIVEHVYPPRRPPVSIMHGYVPPRKIMAPRPRRPIPVVDLEDSGSDSDSEPEPEPEPEAVPVPMEVEESESEDEPEAPPQRRKNPARKCKTSRN